MNINFPIPFTKISGTGNDFIIIDHRQPIIPESSQAEFARLICRRMFSVGADGLILIENSDRADFQWRFFNADGSTAEMCGNGARCAARFAFTNDIASNVMKFATVAGIIEAEVKAETVKIRLTRPEDISLDISLLVGGENRRLAFVNTGVPHVVFFLEDIAAIPVIEWGRYIRNHELFQPAGTNVNFVQKAEGCLKVRTYERGVEDETMACGTGATAAALIAALQDGIASPVRVQTSGGDILAIHFSLADSPEKEVQEVFLEGPTNIVYQGRLRPEALK